MHLVQKWASPCTPYKVFFFKSPALQAMCAPIPSLQGRGESEASESVFWASQIGQWNGLCVEFGKSVG